MILHLPLRALKASVISLATVLSLGIACSSEEDDPAVSACDQIMNTCHEKDRGILGDPVTECHGLSEISSEATCQERLDECVETCESAPAIGEGGAGGETHDPDAGELDPHAGHDAG